MLAMGFILNIHRGIQKAVSYRNASPPRIRGHRLQTLEGAASNSKVNVLY